MIKQTQTVGHGWHTKSIAISSLMCALAGTGCLGAADETAGEGAVGSTSGEIVGGVEVHNDRAFPASMALYRNFPGYGWFPSCGAVLIRKNWALTAGHCVIAYDDSFEPPAKRVLAPEELTLGIGSTDLRSYGAILDAAGPDGRHVIAAKVAHLHPLYQDHYPDGITYDSYDVAVIKLDKNAWAEPANFIASEREEARVAPPGALVQAIGWGATDGEATVYPDILNKVILRMPTRASCAAAYSDRYDVDVIDPTHLCAGGGSKDTCFGDSGSPLFGWRNGKRVVVGLASFGDEFQCAIPGLPGGYSRMATLGGWVERCIRDEAQCDIP